MCASLNEVRKNDAYGVSQRGYNDACSESEGMLHGSKSMPVSMKNMLPSPTMVNMCDVLQNKGVADDEKSKVANTYTISAATDAEDVNSSQPQESDQRSHLVALEILEGTFKDIPYKEYANFLGNDSNHQILTKFIKSLSPLPSSLLETLFNLSKSIYFIAEAQNIDRILECLSKEWIACHPNTHWKSGYKSCHIVLFSLLILNSDLHNDFQVDHKKIRFSMVAFINNTLRALREESEYEKLEIYSGEHLIIEELSEYYKTLNETPLPLCAESRTSISTSDNQSSLKRFSTLGSREFSTSNLRSVNSNSTTLYSRNGQVSVREMSAKSNKNFHNNHPMEALYLKESFDDDLITEKGSSWFMDDLILISKKSLPRKYSKRDKDQVTAPKIASKRNKSLFGWLKPSKTTTLVEHTSRKTSLSYLNKDSEWERVKIQIKEGRMFIFKIKPDVKDVIQSSETDTATMDYFKDISSSYFAYSLLEAEAQVVQDNIIIGSGAMKSNMSYKNTKRKGNFIINFPENIDGPKLVLEFQTRNVEEAHKFMDCINFWAGRISPVPLTQFEVVSNAEYGWSDKVLTDHAFLNLRNIIISEWKPLLGLELLYEDAKDVEMIKLKERLKELMNFTRQLGVWIDKHNEIKDELVEIWSFDDSCFEAVMNNWNSKYLYMNNQYKKRLSYLKALQKAMGSVQF
ncbi:Arf family guanine nucleotide exchange factor YEL1 [Saccharomyces paradoxus]|uniref:Guanine-nucleotide exchange factor YEL1 n=1 Tax=Saccharomyces paradoxus TaxID=27291 RepID=A0A8B8UL96_SACPA|nr:Yel1 [Saccharomyces paradoxus]QHS71507.1 Yel1 [Saccharomyces paradoxus]